MSFDLMLSTKRILRKLGCDEISGKVYTFDGDTSGKFADNNLVNISEDVPDLVNVTKIIFVTSDGATIEYPLSHLTYAKEEGMSALLDTADSNKMLVVSLYSGVGGGPAGLYVYCSDGVYVSRIEFAETIHPIDKKYLPGVCLPVVELSTNFTDGAACTTEENAVLKKAFEANTPIVVRCNIVVGDVTYTDCSSVWNRMIVGDICSFVIQIGKILQIYSIDNGATWGCLIE